MCRVRASVVAGMEVAAKVPSRNSVEVNGKPLGVPAKPEKPEVSSLQPYDRHGKTKALPAAGASVTGISSC